MPAKMTMQGRQAVGRKMQALAGKIRVPVQKAVTDGAEQIARQQRNLVPERTGKLKRSIVVTPPGQSTPAYSQPGGSSRTREYEAKVTAGNSEVRYAHLVEYGTASHPQGGQFTGTQHPGTPAEPYFWPGYRLERKPVRAKIRREIRKAIKAAYEA